MKVFISWPHDDRCDEDAGESQRLEVAGGVNVGTMTRSVFHQLSTSVAFDADLCLTSPK